MADYSPLFDQSPLPLTTSAAVTGGQVLIISGSGTVAPSATASGAWIGVAAFDAATGTRVTVHTGGVQLVTASGAITAGATVAAAAAGAVAAFGAGTDYSQVVGIALTTAANGQPVQVKLVR